MIEMTAAEEIVEVLNRHKIAINLTDRIFSEVKNIIQNSVVPYYPVEEESDEEEPENE